MKHSGRDTDADRKGRRSSRRSLALAAIFTLLALPQDGTQAANSTSPKDRVGVGCTYRDGIVTRIVMDRRVLPDTTIRTITAHCALQRALGMGGVDNFHDFLVVDQRPMVDLPPRTPGGDDDPPEEQGTMLSCGLTFYEKKEVAACQDDEGNEGIVTTTYSCRVMQVPKLVDGEWQCIDDPDTEVCVYISDSDCEVPEAPEDVQTPW